VTSPVRKTQIFIGSVNWLLMGAVLLILWIFEYSANPANAHGLAVTGSMTLTGIMLVAI
jgi:KUP system potassium uptake protein